MARYRSALPQLDGRLFLTDGGIETTLIFLDGLVVFGGCCGTDARHVGAIGEACAPLFARA